MSEQVLYCWQCGTALPDVPLPVSRRESCPSCDADLHVCRQCEFYDTSAAKDCREPVADEVVDKERANACDYFRPRFGVMGTENDEAAAARAKLSALFGEPTGGDPLKQDVEKKQKESESEAEAARRKLEALFGKEGTKK